jgi:DNA invertase Pin-like site-specific DNA recombinase
MPQQQFITYTRVSTQRQGQSGLGLDAQRYAVAQYLGANRRHVIGEFVEVESGRKTNRPELLKALAACRFHGATLVVAKVDRLARNAAFLLALRDSGIDFVCADMPQANRLTIGILAVVAEAEADALATRAREAAAARIRRGDKIGNVANFGAEGRRKAVLASVASRRAVVCARASTLAPIIRELRAGGARSTRAIAAGLDARGIAAPQGGKWWSATVHSLLRRMDYRPTLDEALALIRMELRHRGGYRCRNAQMYHARKAGRTLTSLAAEHGLTPERVRQLCYLEQRRRQRTSRPRQKRSPTGDLDLRVYLERLLMEE